MCFLFFWFGLGVLRSVYGIKICKDFLRTCAGNVQNKCNPMTVQAFDITWCFLSSIRQESPWKLLIYNKSTTQHFQILTKLKHTPLLAIICVCFFLHHFWQLGEYIGKLFLHRVEKCVHVRDEFGKLIIIFFSGGLMTVLRC